MNPIHEYYMRRCLELARLGQGKTDSNPMVGAVVLDSHGRKVGEGLHSQFGGPHAEVIALEQAEERASGGTLYVNLEPCSHTGKTPPCTEKILSSGIRTLFCGMLDPNPKVAGTGVKTLQAKGLTVYFGILEGECKKLNEAFCHFIQTGEPYVVLKIAMTLDGKIATRSGESRWISGPLSRRWVHQLRSESNAILTTAETILKDNSLLTVRQAPILGKPPVRIILDRQLRLNPDSHPIFKPTSDGGDVWIFTGQGNENTVYANRAQALGAHMFEVKEDGQKLDMSEVINVISRYEIAQLMVEAGGGLAGTLLNENRIHKLWLLYGDKIMADSSAKPGFSGGPIFQLKDAPAVRFSNSFNIENNWIVEAYPLYRRSSASAAY